MQLQAKANLAAMKTKLAAAKQTQELEQKVQQMTQVVEQQKLQVEINAAEAREQVISQALEEEEVIPLLHSPSRSIIPPISAQNSTSAPNLTQDHTPVMQNTYPHVLPVSTHTQRFIPEQQPAINTHGETFVHQPIQTTPSNTYQRPVPAMRTPGSIAASPATNGSFIPDQQAFANTLAQAIHSAQLKPAEPFIFYGDPLTYLDWKVAFEGLIECGNHSSLQKLALLQQYLGGKPKDAVTGYFRIGTEEAFRDAKKKLDERYGQPHVLSEAYRSKLDQWPNIKEHDGESLQELADFLESCKTAMATLPELGCLNDRRENMKM